MGAAQRRKGATFEREIANLLKPLDPSAKRNVEETQSASFDVKTKLPLAIQAKNFARWHVTPHDILQQAEEGAATCPGDRRQAVGVVRISGKRPDLVIMSWDTFFDWLGRLYGKEEAAGTKSSLG